MDEKRKKSSHPALSPKQREDRLISLAYDRTEAMLADPNSKVSSQMLTYLLKRGTIEAEIELEKLKKENKLLEAKTDAIETSKREAELYEEAMRKFRYYSGEDED